MLERFLIGRIDISISHLQFADDTICFIKVEEKQVKILKHISLMFETISGLKVNLSKSSMADIDVDEVVLGNFAEEFRCKVETWPLKYLGLLLGGSPRTLSFLDTVVEGVQKKMPYWKKKILHFIGSIITLIKVAISNISVYYMSLFKI